MPALSAASHSVDISPVHYGTTVIDLPSAPPAPTTAACMPDQAKRYETVIDNFDRWRVRDRRPGTRRTTLRRDGFPPVSHGGVVPLDPSVDSGFSPATASLTGAALPAVRGLQQPDIVDEDCPRGCPWDENTSYADGAGGYLGGLRWATSNGCR